MTDPIRPEDFGHTYEKKYLKLPRKSHIVSEKPLLAVDFDGVLHHASKGFHDGNVYDLPVEGAVPFMHKAQQHFTVVVFSARARTPQGKSDIKRFLKQYGFPDVEVTSEKTPAFLTIDDRAITFTGTFPEDPAQLLEFTTWTGAKWGLKRVP